MSEVSSLCSGLQKVGSGPHVAAPVQITKDDVRERYQRQRDLSKIRVIPAKPEANPFDTNTRKRVVVYCRVSTDGIQQTSSFELQKNYYLRFVRKKPEWKLVGLYSDEGITATSTDHRIGMLTMLEDARAGKFDIIVVKNLSRFSRNLMDCMKIIYELRDLPHPVGILFETENMYTLDKNVDFTLQVLSLVAQEESHKKSEAMNSSYQMRFSNGQFTKPDLLGYDKAGVNEICVNEIEAQTVQLIFMMYLAGNDPEEIAETLNRLGRRKHTHVCKDGRVKGGEVNWTKGSVLNVITNERRCGDVLAQKTFTPNYLDHKAKQNRNNLPKYYAQDQHPAIVSRDDFALANRILEANRGGWRHGLPHLGFYSDGPLEGFVSSIPQWKGFSSEDYLKASLKGQGVSDEDIEALSAQTSEEEDYGESVSSAVSSFQHSFKIDSDDYELFPDAEATNAPDEADAADDPVGGLVASLRESTPKVDNHDRFGTYDLTGCQVVRPQLLSTGKKISMTADYRGLYFNTQCGRRLGIEDDSLDAVELAFNPVEQVLLVKKSSGAAEKSIRWRGYGADNRVIMKRCTCHGLSTVLYDSMSWNPEYKYRVLGRAVEVDGETMLAFFLDENMMIVPAKAGSVQDIDTDDTSIGEDGSVEKSMARSRAIYYDELTEKAKGDLTLEDLGNKRYDPECIRLLLERGISPKEGWFYLKGIAVIKDNGFTIIPEKWIGSFGNDPYEQTSETRFLSRLRAREGSQSDEQPYGWTVGLSLPSQETVREAIAFLDAQRQSDSPQQ